MKGISPGPFTEEFLTREQGTLRLLGALCMAGDIASCMLAMMAVVSLEQLNTPCSGC